VGSNGHTTVLKSIYENSSRHETVKNGNARQTIELDQQYDLKTADQIISIKHEIMPIQDLDYFD
jgi:hypothetical protein